MNIAIVDDTASEAGFLSRMLKEYMELNKVKVEIVLFSSAKDLIESYSPLRFTMIFLDIYMEGMTGIEAARAIRKTDEDALLIFLTSSREHYAEAFSVHAYDYLSKPLEKKRLFRLMDDVMRMKTAESLSLAFTCDKTEYRVPFGDIEFIRTNGHYLEITERSGKKYSTRMTFAEAAAELGKDKRFLTVNRGIAVNMECIEELRYGCCCLTGEHILPINTRSARAIEQTWQNYMFSEIRKSPSGRSGR